MPQGWAWQHPDMHQRDHGHPCVQRRRWSHTRTGLSPNPAVQRLRGSPSVISLHLNSFSMCSGLEAFKSLTKLFHSAPSDAQVLQAHLACASSAGRAGSLCPSCAGALLSVPAPSRVLGEGRGSSAGEDKLLKWLDMQAAEAFPGSQAFLEVGSWCQRTSLGELHG